MLKYFTIKCKLIQNNFLKCRKHTKKRSQISTLSNWHLKYKYITFLSLIVRKGKISYSYNFKCLFGFWEYKKINIFSTCRTYKIQ